MQNRNQTVGRHKESSRQNRFIKWIKCLFRLRDTNEKTMDVEVKTPSHNDMYNIQQSYLKQSTKHLKMEATEKGQETSLVEPTVTLAIRPAPPRTPGGL